MNNTIFPEQINQDCPQGQHSDSPDRHSKREQQTLSVASQRMEEMEEETAMPLSSSSISMKVILLEDYQQGGFCFKTYFIQFYFILFNSM